MLTIVERVLILQDSSLCRALPVAALVRLALVATEEHRSPGPLWLAGDAADAIFFVLDGAVVVKETTVGAGRDVGAGALLGAGPRTTSAFVPRKSLLLRVGRDDFLDVLGTHPSAARALLLNLGARLGERDHAALDLPDARS
jgi:CRP-like cAMP-binding protein